MRYDHVIIHNFDADTCVAPNYFDYVAYKYLTSVMGSRPHFSRNSFIQIIFGMHRL